MPVRVATPFDIVAVPSTVEPSLNVTVPVGVPLVVEVTVAVRVATSPEVIAAVTRGGGWSLDGEECCFRHRGVVWIAGREGCA